MMNKRKIIAVTGARSEYDLLFKVYERLNSLHEIDFGIIVTGPHLADTFGYTVQNIEKDGFRIAGKIFNLVDSNQKIGRAVSIGYQIPSLAHLLLSENPDIVLIAGDREEAISVSLTCAYMDIAVAHFFGGDIAKDGNIDNSVRYATSKLAHIHFPTLEEHKATLLKLGEDDWRIFVVGNPALDRFIDAPALSSEETIERITDKKIDKYCVLIQHSIITEVEEQAAHIRMTLNAILQSGIHCFVNYPNSDAGSADIIKAYQEYVQKYPLHFTLFQNLDRVTYINLLRHASFLIGNSSSGIIEVGTIGLPAINVGKRQRGRIHGNNVVFVENNEEQICRAIQYVTENENFLSKVKECNNPYGDGKSTDRIVKILKEITVDSKLIHKNITY